MEKKKNVSRETLKTDNGTYTQEELSSLIGDKTLIKNNECSPVKDECLIDLNKQKEMNKLHYDGKLCISKHRFLNLIMSMRGGGKSFWFKRYCVDNFLKTGQKFIYMRRYQTDIEKALANKEGSFWNDLIKEGYFLNHDVKEDMNGFYIDGKQCGYYIALSSAVSRKSISYKDVSIVVYEEFLLAKGKVRPLKNEPQELLDFLNTVDRYEDRVTCFCLANTIDYANEYFQYFNIFPKIGDEFTMKKQVLVQVWENFAFEEYAKKSRLGELISGTDYGDYAIGSKFLMNDEHFIEEKTPKSLYSFGFHFNGKNYGVWCDETVGKFFVNTQHDSMRYTFVFTLEDMRPNTLMLTRKKPEMLRHFCENFRLGNVYSNNQTTKRAVFDLMKLIG